MTAKKADLSEVEHGMMVLGPASIPDATRRSSVRTFEFGKPDEGIGAVAPSQRTFSPADAPGAFWPSPETLTGRHRCVPALSKESTGSTFLTRANSRPRRTA